MMDCEQIRDLLDAYALGAADAQEAAALEEHVADCVRCWSSLDEAQRAAAAIALSTAIQHAPPSLRSRVLAATQRPVRPLLTKLLAPLPRLWPAGVGVVAAAAASSLAFAMFLQTEVSDLRDDSDQLAAEIESASSRLSLQQQAIAVEVDTTGEQLAQQQELMSVLAAPDVEQVSLQPSDPASPAVAVYYWSAALGAGALLCSNLPALRQGSVYQVWLLAEGDAYPVETFQAWNGIGQLGMDLTSTPGMEQAIGVTIEDATGAQEPSEMVLFAELPR